VIVDLPITLNILFNFSKQASSLKHPRNLLHFSDFLQLNFNLLGWISDITTPICETDVTRTS